MPGTSSVLRYLHTCNSCQEIETRDYAFFSNYVNSLFLGRTLDKMAAIFCPTGHCSEPDNPHELSAGDFQLVTGLSRSSSTSFDHHVRLTDVTPLNKFASITVQGLG